MVADESAVGRTGVLVVGTRGNAGPGEALIGIRGGTEAFLAWSDRPLAEGTSILVVDTVGVRTVYVVEWTDPVQQQ